MGPSLKRLSPPLPPQSETGTNYYKEIPLSEILAVNTSRSASSAAAAAAAAATAAAATEGSASSASSSSHCFEIRTANVDFYVGDVAPAPKRDSGTGPEVRWLFGACRLIGAGAFCAFTLPTE